MEKEIELPEIKISEDRIWVTLDWAMRLAQQVVDEYNKP